MRGWPIKDILLGLFLLGGILILLQFSLCLFGTTIKANSIQDPPPNKFQWRAGAECFKREYYGWIFNK